MLANIQNYIPEEIKFVLTDAVKEKFPLILFEGADNPDEVIKKVTENFIAIFPEKENSTRHLDRRDTRGVLYQTRRRCA